MCGGYWPSAQRWPSIRRPGSRIRVLRLHPGTDVLGARLADGHHRAAVVLLAVGWLAWLVPGYVVPWSAVLGHSRFPVGQYANGI
jgi:hypothetical protein